MNLANMPIQIVNALKERGYEAEHVQYTLGQGHAFGYKLDREINLKEHGGKVGGHIAMVREYLERDFDIFHFWNKSLMYWNDYTHNTGFDIPLIKARNKHILFRFSGFDVRLPSKDLEANPYSPFRYGYEHKFDEKVQQKYLDFLDEYVDQFLVQDPELQQFCPKAKIIPRALDLQEMQFVGIEKNEKPLIVHAPSNDECKGTKFVVKAVEELQDEGLNFDFKLIKGMKHEEAMAWYKKSDAIVDQLLIGATGVLSLEAMALGKPCLVNLREDLFKPFYGNELPVLNSNPDNIKKNISKIVKDYDHRKHLSKLGRKTVEKHHDINKVIKQFIDLYSDVHKRDIIRPTGLKDVDYLEFQNNYTLKKTTHARVYERSLKELKLTIKDDSLKGLGINCTYDECKEVSKDLHPKLKVAILEQFLPKFVILIMKKFPWYKKAIKQYEGTVVKKVK